MENFTPITVIIPERITPAQFGICPEIFNRSIKGQAIEVTRYGNGFTFVKVEGEEYTIKESDLIPTTPKPEIPTYSIEEITNTIKDIQAW